MIADGQNEDAQIIMLCIVATTKSRENRFSRRWCIMPMVLVGAMLDSDRAQAVAALLFPGYLLLALLILLLVVVVALCYLLRATGEKESAGNG